MLTLLSAGYGRTLLDDPSDVWLEAHEFAHQWWGNGVTCRDWTHFWLNEGIATFMADAYKERRFGRAVLPEGDRGVAGAIRARPRGRARQGAGLCRLGASDRRRSRHRLPQGRLRAAPAERATGRAAVLGRPARLYPDLHGAVGHDAGFSEGDGARQRHRSDGLLPPVGLHRRRRGIVQLYPASGCRFIPPTP